MARCVARFFASALHPHLPVLSGGTPNLGKYVRAIPDAKFGPPDPHENYEKWPKTLPYEVWETMSPHGQHITRGIVAFLKPRMAEIPDTISIAAVMAEEDVPQGRAQIEACLGIQRGRTHCEMA